MDPGNNVETSVAQCTCSPSSVNCVHTENNKLIGAHFCSNGLIHDGEKSQTSKSLTNGTLQHGATELEIDDPNITLGDIHCKVWLRYLC